MYDPAEARRDKIIRLKLQMGGECSECGYNKNFAALDFHHLDPSVKKFGINTNTKGTREQLLEEANKCVLLCRNCHSSTHHPEMDKKAWDTRQKIKASSRKSVVIRTEFLIEKIRQEALAAAVGRQENLT